MIPMGTCPVELATIGTTRKVSIMLGDKRRNSSTSLSRWDFLKDLVADNTATPRLVVNSEPDLKLRSELP